MTLTVQATYENGVLKPDRPLPLKEHEMVQVTIQPQVKGNERASGLIACSDAKLIEWAALDPDLDYPSSEKS